MATQSHVQSTVGDHRRRKTRAKRALFVKNKRFVRVLPPDKHKNSNETHPFIKKTTFRSSFVSRRTPKLERNTAFYPKTNVSLEFLLFKDAKTRAKRCFTKGPKRPQNAPKPRSALPVIEKGL